MDPRLTDKGGGGRFEALTDITDMDYIMVNNNKHVKHARRLSDSELESLSSSKFRREEEKTEKQGLTTVSTNAHSLYNPNTVYNSENDTVDHLLIVELINKSISTKLIEDRATLRHLLNNSQLGKKSTGIYRYQTIKTRIILHILEVKDIPDLLKLKN